MAYSLRLGFFIDKRAGNYNMNMHLIKYSLNSAFVSGSGFFFFNKHGQQHTSHTFLPVKYTNITVSMPVPSVASFPSLISLR